jgi:hypothetical protein
VPVLAPVGLALLEPTCSWAPRPTPPVCSRYLEGAVEAKAFGSPSDARGLGAAAVDEHDDALRQLADS